MHLPLLKSLFLFPLVGTALAQGLTTHQINIVKQRLQEGATHRSVYRSLFAEDVFLAPRWYRMV